MSSFERPTEAPDYTSEFEKKTGTLMETKFYLEKIIEDAAHLNRVSMTSVHEKVRQLGEYLFDKKGYSVSILSKDIYPPTALSLTVDGKALDIRIKPQELKKGIILHHFHDGYLFAVSYRK